MTTTKDLIAIAREEANKWGCPDSSEAVLNQLADALERLTQPVGVEPVAEVDANDDGFWADILPDRDVSVGDKLYSATDLARMVAERDTWKGTAKAAQRHREAAEAERDALQEQVSWIRNHFSACDGGVLITGMDGAFVLKWMSLVDEILAATESKEPAA